MTGGELVVGGYSGQMSTDLANQLQMLIAGKRVVLNAAVHIIMPVSPLHVKLSQCLGATRLKRHQQSSDSEILLLNWRQSGGRGEGETPIDQPLIQRGSGVAQAVIRTK